MPGRNLSAYNYRFGNQKQEGDDEIYGDGASYAFNFRMEDARINRFWTIDPLAAKYPWNSSYAFSENDYVSSFELEGLEKSPMHYLSEKWYGKAAIFLGSAAQAIYQDAKSLGKAETWYHMADIFIVNDGSDPQLEREQYQRTDAVVQYVKNVPNMDAAGWGRLTGHLAFSYALTKTGTLTVRGLGAVFEMPKLRTLSNVAAREWYLAQEAKIPAAIEKTVSLEAKARQAFNLRNTIRTFARELMADRKTAAKLYADDPNLTWDQVYKKYNGDYQKIIDAATRSRESVNEALGVKPKK